MAFEDQRKQMYNPLPPRKDILKSLEEEEFDILVIGGGATGTGVALDAVTRGKFKPLFYLCCFLTPFWYHINRKSTLLT